MVKTWKFRNDGQQAWPQGSSLVLKRCRGEFETAPLPISRLPNPGEEVEVSVTLKALQPGRGRVCYRLVDNNGVPFGKLWADVVAVAQEVKADPPKAEPVKTEPAKETPKESAKESPKEPEQPHRFEIGQPHRFEIALTALASMGFTDRKRNIKILNKEKGNIERTITRLIEGSM
jgi:next-to-BRCA1 protein 1